MIERGGGRTSGLTDWRLMDVLSMWACLHDQDTAGQWKQVAGWRKVCDLALAHLGRLREYRRGLAEAWPPETNAAAQAYVGELDQLIDRVQRTHDAAAANYDALAAAARAIGSARSELQPLYDEFAAKLRQKRAYEATIADPKAVAGSRLPERPPVTDDDLEQLNVRARGLMTGLSGELQLAQVMLQRLPAPARPGPRVDQQSSDPYSGSVPAPIIPPIVPVPAPPSIQSSPQRHSPLRGPASLTASGPGSIIGGPILGNAGPGIVSQAPPLGAAPSTPPPPQTNGANIPQLPPIGAQAFRINPPEIDPISGRRSTQQPPARPAPTNGLIGNPSASSQMGNAYPRRTNPLGAVIGGGGAGTSPSGAAGSRPNPGRGPYAGTQGLAPLGGAPGFSAGQVKHSGKQFEEQPRSFWDPDNPWEVERGVDPVLGPPEEGPIDPGPAIGFDR